MLNGPAIVEPSTNAAAAVAIRIGTSARHKNTAKRKPLNMRPNHKPNVPKPMKTGPFWMVSVTGGGGSHVRHATREEAEAEAKRLCGSGGGNHEVCVLKVESKFTFHSKITKAAVK